MSFKPDSILTAEGWTFIQESTPDSPQFLDTWYIPSTGQVKIFDKFSTWVYLKDFNNSTLPGTVWGWGPNNYGELGLGDTISRLSPVPVSTTVGWLAVCISVNTGMSIFLKANGTIWTCGYNYWGASGTGDTIFRSSPVQVGSLTTWKSIATTGQGCLAIRTDGTLWFWGDSQWGECGIPGGAIYNRSSPVQVGTMTNWSLIYGGQKSTYAIKTDGTLWAWGYNASGQLGIGDIISRSSPVQVGTLTIWTKISHDYDHVLALRNDSTLWSWGSCFYGQCGLTTRSTRSSPMQVGTLATWKDCKAGQYWSAAIKTDGTLWTWGRTSSGTLGGSEPNLTARSSPVQVGILTNWSTISGGANFANALKTDSTIWAWGNGSYLGTGVSINRSSPVQIGASSNWTQIISTFAMR